MHRNNGSVTFQSTKAVYDRIIDLRIATPQIIINYAMFLEEHNYFEDSFKVSAHVYLILKVPVMPIDIFSNEGKIEGVACFFSQFFHCDLIGCILKSKLAAD